MERPIEEVIGWTWDDDQWIDSAGEFTKGATVDDLAAWLDDNVDEWGFARPERTWYVETLRYGWRNVDEGPAILAALTAAVRKVAGDA